MALRLEIKVVPSSGKLHFALDKQQRLKCYLKAAAQDGQANYELIKFVAKSCSVTQRDVQIIAGFTSRNKVLLISTLLNYEQFLDKVGLEQQTQLFEFVYLTKSPILSTIYNRLKYICRGGETGRRTGLKIPR